MFPLSSSTFKLFPFSLWFIFGRLCTDDYHVSLVIFFNSLDAHFSLSKVRVYNPATCTSHNDSLIGCCTWSKFFISSTHHNYCTFITSQFVTDDCFSCFRSSLLSMIVILLLGSYLHRIFFSLFFVIVYLRFSSSLGCFYLCSHLPCTFDGWVLILDSYIMVFLLQVDWGALHVPQVPFCHGLPIQEPH